ncbi:MAG: indolepyruvate ferredoxin oxidoreductase subunit alpha [Clostridiales bacterium]|nr:indolepyruvate ferredoxin oxidoreductase subunit alpha [Clostridiales bacterium]MDD7433194.1 indolepyruvate ferredoxin oxidoreductase subunit alpha [Clostridiales bacterium]MDY3061696.1 indolepyruvate ferredoxin oxidoreductase subunit alpha [Eubacteriales bacterium]
MKQLMSGNEAVARGAWEAGVVFGSAYPGTPSTEIFEAFPNANYEHKVNAEWAPNEKVAVEAAYGASIAGVRALAAMKHVGVNVAADPIFTSAYNGVGAGLVIISADDPSMFSSQNEQDNRHYAEAAKLPMVEPANSQNCKDYIKKAYEISEKFDTPVIFRMTTRVCHSKGVVELGEREEQEPRAYSRQVKKFIASPANAFVHHPELEERLKAMAEFNDQSDLNEVIRGDGKIGVISSGVAYHYAHEAFPEGTSFLKLGMTWPLPEKLIRDFAASVETLYVVEELDPFLEMHIKAMGIACIGKEKLPVCHELNTEIVRECIFGIRAERKELNTPIVARPPALCPGCPHRGFFYTLSRRKDAVISGDIGCYTLGSADPMNAMDSVICMGASLSAGHGYAKAFELSGRKDQYVVFGVIGDSTFFHSGITGAVEIMYNDGRVIPCILDNSITSMTGQQDNPGTGKNLFGEVAARIDIEKLLQAIGFTDVLVVDPQDLKAMKKTIDDAVAFLKEGRRPAIITRRPCLLIKGIKHEKGLCKVDRDTCIGCKSCLRVGCPAIFMKDGKSNIDATLCVGCEVCAQVCPVQAIKKVEA